MRWWYPLVLVRSIFVTFFYLPVFTVVGSVVVIALVKLRLGGENHVIKWWAQSLCWLYGVQVVVRRWFSSTQAPILVKDYQNQSLEDLVSRRVKDGKKGIPSIPKGRGGIVLFNHASFFDIFSLSTVLPALRYGAKKELFSIPFFGRAMRATGVVPIDRDNRDRAISALSSAKGFLDLGGWLALAPEGGRLGGDDRLAAFKSGPFHLILGTQCLVYPVLIRGAAMVWPKGFWLPGLSNWRYTVYLDFLPPLSPVGLTPKDKEVLKDFTWHYMRSWQKQLNTN